MDNYGESFTNQHQPPPLPQSPPPPPPPRGPGAGLTVLQSCLLSGCVTILVPVLMFLGFFGVMAYLLAESLNEAGDTIGSFSGATNLRERVIRAGAAGAGTIAVVKVHGAIGGDGSPLDGNGALFQVSEELRLAGDDDAVKAVLLQIDSPGGGLTASDQLHNEVKRIREKGKRVFVWAGDVMASGGYYIAVGAEGIMASPTCTIGSIGVILQHFQIEGLMEKLGVKVDPIVTGERKDIGSMFRDMKPEERRALHDFIQAGYRRFVGVVAEGRNLPEERVLELADGSIFTAAEALDKGLVDKVGYVRDAIEWIEGGVGEDDMRIVSYRRLPEFLGLFRETGKAAAAAVLENAAAPPAPRSMAVWEGR